MWRETEPWIFLGNSPGGKEQHLSQAPEAAVDGVGSIHKDEAQCAM